MASRGRPSKVKGPNKLVSLVMIAVIAVVLYYQWDRIEPFTRGLFGMYGEGEGLFDPDFRRISSVGKTAVARYWVKNGRPPSSNEQAGLEEGGSYRTTTMRSMEIVPGGAIVFDFAGSKFGPPGEVRLVPDSTGLMQDVVKWSCTTHSYQNLPDCAYTPD